MAETVKYFGYGANASVDMMEAMVGRRPGGFRATLPGFQLRVQHLDEMNDVKGGPTVRNMLVGENNDHYWAKVAQETGKPFVSYTIMRGDGEVKGMVWLLTKEEYALKDNWEDVGNWYQRVTVKVKTSKGAAVEVVTEMLNDRSTARERAESDSRKYSYPYYEIDLNGGGRIFDHAAVVRELFIKDKGPQFQKDLVEGRKVFQQPAKLKSAH